MLSAIRSEEETNSLRIKIQKLLNELDTLCHNKEEFTQFLCDSLLGRASKTASPAIQSCISRIRTESNTDTALINHIVLEKLYWQLQKQNKLPDESFQRTYTEAQIFAWAYMHIMALKSEKSLGYIALDLKKKQLNLLDPEKWNTLCAAISMLPLRIVQLQDNDLSELSSNQRLAFGRALKQACTHTLSFGTNKLGKTRPDRWTAFCVSIAISQVKWLDLKYSDLLSLLPEQWLELGRALKTAGIVSLSVAFNDLDKMSDQQWNAFLLCLQMADLTELNFRGNNAHLLSDKRLIELFNVTRMAGIKALLLGWNYLDKLFLSPERQDIFCDSLATSELSTLDLYTNDLQKLTFEQWLKLFSACKLAGIQTFNLFGNYFDQLSSEQWEDFFNAYKISGITSLGLPQEIFASPVAWVAFCYGLTNARVTTFDFSSMNLDQQKQQQLHTIIMQNRQAERNNSTFYSNNPMHHSLWHKHAAEVADKLSRREHPLASPKITGEPTCKIRL